MGISAIILTRNEEKNIGRCLKSLSWCDEIVIIDDYSEDETIERIHPPAWTSSMRSRAGSSEFRVQKKIRIYKRHLDRDFAVQRNFGLGKARGKWIFFVDTDEVISESLQKEVVAAIKQSSYKGFYLPRKDYFLERWLRYGETNNVKFLRLAQKNAGKWQGRVHEVWKIEGKTGELENPILHYPHESIAYFLGKINEYTDIVAQHWKEEGREVHAWEIIVYPLGKLIRNYILRWGFLDGTAGLIMALMMSFHSFLARSKYWLLTHT